MEPEGSKGGVEPHNEHHHHKPKHIAERMERYVGVGIVVVAAVLLVLLLYSFMQTGSEAPSWMR